MIRFTDALSEMRSSNHIYICIIDSALIQTAQTWGKTYWGASCENAAKDTNQELR